MRRLLAVFAIGLGLSGSVSGSDKPQFRYWVGGPSFNFITEWTFEINGEERTTKGYCEYTVFMSGNVPYYWTLNHYRMNEDPITGIDSIPVRIPFGFDNINDVRVFLDEHQLYGKPTWQWEDKLECRDPRTKDFEGGWGNKGGSNDRT